MADLSSYSLEPLHKDAGLVLCRCRRKDGAGQELVRASANATLPVELTARDQGFGFSKEEVSA
jgi:hypothetical protein